jgi:2-haloacid dehalogenase
MAARRGAATPAAAFDVIGTLFSLDTLPPLLERLGASPHALDLWFAEALRDFFALSHSGSYAPLSEVLAAALPRALETLGVSADAHQRREIMESLQRLEPAESAADGCRLLAEGGWTLLALTNGSRELTESLLRRGGLERYFAEVISCDSLRVSKPNARVYAAARERCPGELWMIAAHAWDVAGALRAGLRGAWIASKEKTYLDVYPTPDVRAGDIAEAARALLGHT